MPLLLQFLHVSCLQLWAIIIVKIGSIFYQQAVTIVRAVLPVRKIITLTQITFNAAYQGVCKERFSCIILPHSHLQWRSDISSLLYSAHMPDDEDMFCVERPYKGEPMGICGFRFLRWYSHPWSAFSVTVTEHSIDNPGKTSRSEKYISLRRIFPIVKERKSVLEGDVIVAT